MVGFFTELLAKSVAGRASARSPVGGHGMPKMKNCTEAIVARRMRGEQSGCAGRKASVKDIGLDRRSSE